MLGRLLICSECGLVDSELLECPNCRSSLKRQASPSRPKFQTASRLKFDDSLAINIGERVCLTGECSSTLVDRLCLTALLPEGGFGSRHVIIIDAGNQSDIDRPHIGGCNDSL